MLILPIFTFITKEFFCEVLVLYQYEDNEINNSLYTVKVRYFVSTIFC